MQGPTVVVLPPGDSEIEMGTSGVLVRIFSARNEDVMERCRNADAFVESDPHVTPFAPWPDPVDGHRIRTYALADVPDEPGRFGRIFRCSTIMVNYLTADEGPRDPSKLSPHHHDDFEQISLQLRRRPTSITCARRGPSTWPTGAMTSTSSAPRRPSP